MRGPALRRLGQGIPRRRFIASLAGMACALALGRWRPSADRGRDSAMAAGSLRSSSNRRIASLGSLFRREHPQDAQRLVRWVESQVPVHGLPTSRERRARIVRERLLKPDRIEREFARGQVMWVDGWQLARSEGAAAVYLDFLDRPDFAQA